MMRRRWLLFGIYLLACTTFTWGQLPVVPGTEEPERPQHRLLQLDQFIPICIFKSIIDAAAVDKF